MSAMTSQHSDLPLAPPSAVRRDHVREFHGDAFLDPYEWLRDKESPEVIAHLEAETAYAEAATAQLAPLRERLFQEVRTRVQETDLSVPWRRGDWWYFTRTVEGGEHSVQCRVPAAEEGWEPPQIVAGQSLPGEQTLLDGNARAQPHEFWSLGAFDITHDGTRMAWAEDTTGDERFTVRVHDFGADRTLDDEIPETSYGAFLSPAGDAVFYTEVDDSWRPWRLRRHVLGTPLEQDITIAQEDDPGLWLGAELSSDRRWLVLEAGCSEYSEVSILRIEEAGEQAPQVVVPRGAGVLASAEPVRIDGRDVVLLQHDRQAPDGRLSLIELSDLPGESAELPGDGFPPGIDIVAPREGLRVLGFAATQHHLVLEVREDILPGLRILPLKGLGTESQAEPHVLEVPGELTAVSLTAAEPDSPVLRFTAESFVIPRRVFDLILDAPGTELPDPVLRREQPVLGDYSAADYSVERDWAQAEDGTRIPITLIRRRDAAQPAPAMVYAYGSYEISMDPSFSYSRISLLDRGAVWAIAHVRGGGELGRQWYESGKKEHKRRTFTDVVAATRHLVARSDIDADRVEIGRAHV